MQYAIGAHADLPPGGEPDISRVEEDGLHAVVPERLVVMLETLMPQLAADLAKPHPRVEQLKHQPDGADAVRFDGRLVAIACSLLVSHRHALRILMLRDGQEMGDDQPVLFA